jgi:hypothetical protein
MMFFDTEDKVIIVRALKFLKEECIKAGLLNNTRIDKIIDQITPDEEKGNDGIKTTN